MKRTLSIILAIVFALSCCFALAACGKDEGGNESGGNEESKAEFGFEGTKEVAEQGTVNTTADEITISGDASQVKIGFILVGDDTEGYTKAHMDGIKAAAKELGIADDQLIWKYKIEETDAVTEAGKQLINDGCTYIFSNSYGHQDYMLGLAKENSDIHFVSMTGDTAKKNNLSNFSNAFTGVYESRYVSGVVAGLKLQELIDAGKVADKNKDDSGNIRIGYVGAYPYAEVVSGYTAFYLGIKSIVPNIVMDVQYTSSWFDFDKEKAAAELLMNRGCIIIGQHADSAGAPTAVQEAFKKGEVVYSVGYNVSMLDAAPDAALTSASNNWKVYYKYAFAQAINGDDIATNWAAGYSKDAVEITELGKSVAEGTDARVQEVINDIVAGKINVFDTKSFTIGGKTVTWAYATDSDGDFAYDTDNAIKDGAFLESYIQSAPAFALRIDGITELNPKG